MSKHTPGPWIADAQDFESGPAMVDGTLIIAEGAPAGEKCVAECHSPTRMDADARLIAAAPDLLSAMERIAEDDGSDPHGGYVDEWTEAEAFSRVQEIARAAIAKATGAGA